VKVEDLPNRGSTEIVKITYQLTKTVAEDVKKEVEQQMGPFGKVIALGRLNQLVLLDSAGNLRQLIKKLDEMEKKEQEQKPFSHNGIYIRRPDAEQILKGQMGDPQDMYRRQMIMAAQLQQQQQQRQGGQPAPAPAMPQIRMFYISVDDRLNTVLVTGPADKTAQ